MRAIDGDDLLRMVNFLLATIYTPAFVEILTALKEYLEKPPPSPLTTFDRRGGGKNTKTGNSVVLFAERSHWRLDIARSLSLVFATTAAQI